MKKEEKNRSEDVVRQKLEGFRNKLLDRYGEVGVKKIKKIFWSIIIALAVLTALFFCLRVNRIEVCGDVTMFNEGDVISAAGISEGDMLFSASSGSIERSVHKALPLASEVNVKKSLFGKITIEVKFDPVKYFCQIDGMYYALDEDLRIMDADKSKSKYTAYGAIKIVIPETRQPEIGEYIVFYDTVAETDEEEETIYEVKKGDYYKYISDFLHALTKSGYLPDANGVILDEKFNITLIYAEKYSINFGRADELDAKFRVLFGILEEGSLQYADKVSINLLSPATPSARADSSLDFTEFIEE